MSLTLVLQVAAGLVLGGAFLWLFVLVGTRLSERRRDRGISTHQARMEINAIRRRTVRQLFDIANGRDGFVPPRRSRGRFLDEGEKEP
ncbi:hypothetical protein [Miltoncostaea oceani]|uniref:hypothetical protein n=1 Tax=Miltoncostaea oceani TaxID=2843216 RepID=UPI001C3CE9D6|nr:hypothetical protein [Miltoncostaea oceani]